MRLYMVGYQTTLSSETERSEDQELIRRQAQSLYVSFMAGLCTFLSACPIPVIHTSDYATKMKRLRIIHQKTKIADSMLENIAN